MNLDDIRTIAVIGAGDMGHGIAEVSLMAGYNVFLRDVNQEFLDRGISRLNESLKKLVEKEKVTTEHYDRIQKELLHPCLDLKEAVQGADLVIEVIPEIPELKMDTFREMDQSAPSHTLLASNTSSISITDISSATQRPDKVMGLHFFNPVVLMKLVEVIRGDKTSEETMKMGYGFCEKIAKIPVRAEKDVPGFIVNRINAPAGVLRGCIVDNGIATPEEFDAVMKKLGAPMGPFELADYVGIDVSYHVMKYYAEKIHSDYTPGRKMEEMVKAGDFGKKTGKGFYDWSEGRPEIDLSKATDKVDPMDTMAVRINEATKLIEMGVCPADAIDRAVINASGDTVGPMEVAKDQDTKELTERLERLAEKFGKEIFRPTKMIREGTYR
ncbi:3-hydroxyacyl-CoA dehydrogenase family protein [Thermodesulfobacteriota bacterium]